MSHQVCHGGGVLHRDEIIGIDWGYFFFVGVFLIDI